MANGLNQLSSIGGSATAHDARGNLTSDPTTGKTYDYSSENLLTSASGGVTFGYDPAMRLYQVAGAGTVRFAYDGLDAIAEYDGSNALQRRFVFGPGVDEPLVQYEGSGTGSPRFLHADERGSIVAVSDSSSAMLAINKYDEFGKPQTGNSGRFQYTGQMWLPEIGLYHYKARAYAPHLGRFMQTDPAGYADGPNAYAYVLNSPIDLTDPSGMDSRDCSGTRLCNPGSVFGTGQSGFSTAGVGGRTGMTVGDAYAAAGSVLGSGASAASIEAAVDYLTYQGSLARLAATLPYSPQRQLAGGAFAEGPGASSGYICLDICDSRSLTTKEQNFYQSMGLPREVLVRAVLIEGLPLLVYADPDVRGFTSYNNIYLRDGIGSAFSNPDRVGLIGHELFHSWQYSQGATPLDFIVQRIVYGPRDGPLERGAYTFGDLITCRLSGTC